jgi:hypothetical protein
MKDWILLTQDRTGWNSWTRKRRNKFRRRWLRKNGFPFQWYASTYRCYIQHVCEELEEMIFHVRMH